MALQALAVYQLVFRAHGAPNFRRGGAFVAVGTSGRPVPYAPAVAASDAGTVTTTTTAAVTAPPITGAGEPPDGASEGSVSGAVTDAGRPADVPAVATYTYAVAGSERAT